MRRTPLFSGIMYFLLGFLFTYFAIQDIQESGWGFYVYLLIILATFDFGSGIKMILLHFAYKNKMDK
jgi:hypothetical protein